MQENPASPTSRLLQKYYRFGSVPYFLSATLCFTEERLSFKHHKTVAKSASVASLNEALKHRHTWSTRYKPCLERGSVEERRLPGPGCESLGFHFSASRQHEC